MSDALIQLRNACAPGTPAVASQYVDCTKVRGGNVFASKVQADLIGHPIFVTERDLPTKKGFLHYLFSGHVGSGKSSELLHLKECLEKTESPQSSRFFTIVIDASEYLDEYDVKALDILLAIVSEVADEFRGRLNVELKDGYFSKRLEAIKKFLLTDVELEATELTLGNAKSKLKLLRTDPTAREQVRAALMPQTLSLLSEINTFFIEARIEVRKKGFQDFVLVIDNLEKIERFDDNAQGEASQRALFVEGAPQLTSLQAHVVFTVPLTLVRRIGPSLTTLYGRVPFVLPMIKTEQRRTHLPYDEGREILRTILRKRTSEPLETLFTKEALDFLVQYCGGHVRQFMTSVQEATLYTMGEQVDLQAAQRAVAQSVPLYSTQMGPAQWEKLATLEHSLDQQWDQTDSDTVRFLEQWYVLEYVNGGIERDPFNPAMPWYAVHPIVRELNPFKEAVKRQTTVALMP